jgi:hypothetical protein
VRVQEVRWEGGETELAVECKFFYGNGNETPESGTGFFVHKRIILSVKRAVFDSDRISYVVLRGHWCHSFVLKFIPQNKILLLMCWVASPKNWNVCSINSLTIL